MCEKMRTFATDIHHNSYSDMNNVSFPRITITVQAEPWADGHVARITPTRAISATPRQHRTINTNVLPR